MEASHLHSRYIAQVKTLLMRLFRAFVLQYCGIAYNDFRVITVIAQNLLDLVNRLFSSRKFLRVCYIRRNINEIEMERNSKPRDGALAMKRAIHRQYGNDRHCHGVALFVDAA